MFLILQANLSSPSSTISDSQLVRILLLSRGPTLENSDLLRQLCQRESELRINVLPIFAYLSNKSY